MNILIVDDEISIRQLLVICLESLFKNINIFEASNANDAIKLYSQQKSLDAVFTDFEMPGGNGDKLINFLSDKKFQGKVVLYTSNTLQTFSGLAESLKTLLHLYLQKPLTYRELSHKIKDFFQVEISLEFQPIRIAYFFRYNKSLVDVFLSIDNRFIKIINRDDFYEKKDIDKYIHKNVKYLYVRHGDIDVFTDRVGRKQFLQYDESLEPILPGELAAKIHFVLRDIIQSVGVDENVIELCEVYFDEVDKVDDKKLTSLLFNFKNRRDYLYDHSFLTACLANFIVKKMSWYNSGLSQKLSFASLFHDITLLSPEIALAHDLDKNSMKNFSIEEISAFKNHPQKASDLLRSSSFFDPDTIDIVMSQHEKFDGSGIPGRLSGNNIRRLSCVFILSHEFVRLMYIQDFNEKSHKDILTYLFNTYNSGNFKEILDALYSTLSLNNHYKD